MNCRIVRWRHGWSRMTEVRACRHWRRHRRGNWGEKKRGDVDQSRLNWGRSPLALACQGESLASSLLLIGDFSCSVRCSLCRPTAIVVVDISAGGTSVASFLYLSESKPQSTSDRFYARRLMNAGIRVYVSGGVRTSGPPFRRSESILTMIKATLSLRTLLFGDGFA